MNTRKMTNAKHWERERCIEPECLEEVDRGDWPLDEAPQTVQFGDRECSKCENCKERQRLEYLKQILIAIQFGNPLPVISNPEDKID